MGRIEKTVFISYRRVNVSWALAIFQNLTQNGYDVFFDFMGIASGDFDAVILDNIRARAHFLVLLTPTALERCAEPTDWLRREIETALDAGRNIVPLLLDGFDFSSATVTNQLFGKLAALKRYNALRVPADYFSEAMGRLRERFLNVPLDAVLQPASSFAQEAAREHQSAAHDAPEVQNTELRRPVEPQETQANKNSQATKTEPPQTMGRPDWLLVSPKAPDFNAPFLLAIEDAFRIESRGTAVTGRIERGKIKAGDDVEIVGFRETRSAFVVGVEKSRKLVDIGVAGNSVGLLLRDIRENEVERGMVLAEPGSIRPHIKFKADVYLLTKEEGGRQTPFFRGFQAQFYFRTEDVHGFAELPTGVDRIEPGDNVSLLIELSRPVAIEEGLVFAVREADHTVGAGRVSLPLAYP